MKKLKVALLALTLITGFSCKKEVQSNQPENQKTFVQENTEIYSKSAFDYYWFDDGTGGTFYDGAYGVWKNYNEYSDFVTFWILADQWSSYPPNAIAHEYVYGVPDETILRDYFEEIEFNGPIAYINYTSTNIGTLANYFHTDDLTDIEDGVLIPEIHFYQDTEQFEVVKLYDNTNTLVKVYRVDFG